MDNIAINWIKSTKYVPYPDALSRMEDIVGGILKGNKTDTVWLLEHPAMYTAGTSANVADLIAPDRFPVFEARRGGEYTYHGPGQRVAYAMLDLGKHGKDVRKFVWMLEEWVIKTLATLDVIGERRQGRVGVWVQRPDKPALPDGSMAEDKIAAIGVRIRRWVSFHGISINVAPDLDHYSGIIPCGIAQYGVTSLRDLGKETDMKTVDSALKAAFCHVFGS